MHSEADGITTKSFFNQPEIQLFKCEFLLVFFVLYASVLNIFGFCWFEQIGSFKT